MLGYDPASDDEIRGQLSLGLGYRFDDIARARTITQLRAQLPERIHAYEDGVSFGQFFADICNETPATKELLCDTIENLIGVREVEVLGPRGERRRKAGAIRDQDVIRAPSQRFFIF
jgi:hypothetical protein